MIDQPMNLEQQEIDENRLIANLVGRHAGLRRFFIQR